MSIIVSNCHHCDKQQFQTLSCVHYTIFSVIKLDLFIRALVLDRILALKKNYAYASVHLEINCYFQYSIHVQVFFTDVNIHLATSNTSGDVSTSILRFGIAVDGVQLSNNDTSTNSTTTRVRRDVSSDAVEFEVELSVSKVNIHCTAQ